MPSTYQTGSQNERRSMELDTKDGYLCWKPSRNRFAVKGHIDMLSTPERDGFDYVAFKEGAPLRFVQVTTNTVPRQKVESMLAWIDAFAKNQTNCPPEHGCIEIYLDVWSKVKNRWSRVRYNHTMMLAAKKKWEAWHARRKKKQEGQAYPMLPAEPPISGLS